MKILRFDGPLGGPDSCPQAGELFDSRKVPEGPTHVEPILGTAVPPMVLVTGMLDFRIYENRIYYVLGASGGSRRLSPGRGAS